MSHPERPRPEEIFGFTERERLVDQMSHPRFLALLDDEQTAVHSLELSSNTYGEFLFVLVSRPAGDRRVALTFWGAGYHQYRERWIAEEWFWYQSEATGKRLEQRIPGEEAKAMLEERHQEVVAHSRNERQSKRGRLFEMIADLTDDDGAIVDMEDLGEWFLGEEDDDT